jgi:dihydrofolate reductase
MIALVAAIARNQVIGQHGQMPWHLPADLAYFKQLTLGHSVVMGRKTFESIGKPLPNRENVIITKNMGYQKEGCLILHSMDEACAFCAGRETFIIGGAQIYQEFFSYADRLYITFIDEVFSGDSFFPEFDEKRWRLVSKTKGEQNEQNPYDYYFLVYEKI